ncbi:hypothetical protein CKALI_07565 [Corynebacterium kalinowskii]|uniref:DUF4386 domain-containing protein n=1 Tax=Corynebacterium kalinowskii TaxID=2675216 RepID=A0A6B8VTV3_9CORY|nr:hypothetical protein [Corynebacterium kalinowskii]QGU02375.1 hypothetical protein CKALI_07565 [Corynebacterium kalinowskii]
MSAIDHTVKSAISVYPRTNSLALITGGLAWIGYLFTQSGAVLLGVNSIHGCLLRLGAAMLYLLGTVLIFVSFRRSAPKSALMLFVFNAVAVGFYVRAVTHLLEVQPNVTSFTTNYHIAQVLMAVAVFFMAHCLQLDERFPKWLAVFFYLYAVVCALQTGLHLAGLPIRPYDPEVMVLTVVSELTFAFMLIRVGANQLNEQEQLLRTAKM